MSSETVKELFRNLETTLHDRLKVIEEILSLSKQTTLVPTTHDASIEELQTKFRSLNDFAVSQVKSLQEQQEHFEQRLASLEKSMKSAVVSFQSINETIDAMQQRLVVTKEEEKPVEVAEVEAEIEQAQEEALDAETEVEETEEEVEEEVEEEELELEEIKAKRGKKMVTCYHDQHNNVYFADEEGCVDPSEVMGIYNPKTKEVTWN